jgi:hypothetical protein
MRAPGGAGGAPRGGAVSALLSLVCVSLYVLEPIMNFGAPDFADEISSSNLGRRINTNKLNDSLFINAWMVS